MTSILLVEDRDDNRESYTELFKSEGVNVYSAESKDKALSIYKKYASKISGVITDVRLDETDDEDDSGIKLYQKIKQHDARIPIVGISAYSVGKYKLFDYFYKKVAVDNTEDFISNISSIKNVFQEYESNKYADASEMLLKIKDKYKISDADFKEMTSSIPLSNKLQGILLALHKMVSEDEFLKSDDSIVIVIGSKTSTGISHKIRADLPIVCTKTDENIYIAEVLSLPTIYSYGDTKEESINTLIGTLKEYYQELEDTSDQGVDIVRFGKFLKEVFDG